MMLTKERDAPPLE
jgi:SRSO17 transposase